MQNVGCNVGGSSLYNSVTLGKYGGISLKHTSVFSDSSCVFVILFSSLLFSDSEVILVTLYIHECRCITAN